MSITPEQQEIMDSVNAAFDPLMVEGRVYHSYTILQKNGSSGKPLHYMKEENGKIKPEYSGEDLDALSDAERNLPYGKDLDKLCSDCPPFTKVKFTFQKGKPMTMIRCGTKELVEDLEAEMLEEAASFDKDPVLKWESLVTFIGDKPAMDKLTTMHFKERINTYDSFIAYELAECLYHALEGKLKKMYLKYENGNVEIQSEPAYPELKMNPLTKTEIEMEPAYVKRRAALAEGIAMRRKIYESWGKVDDRKIYLSIGGFRDYSWPEDSRTHISPKLSVIYTEDSTILISDGLSDIYTSERSDPELQYNGIGAEFYFEFEGHISFGILSEHFCVPFLNAVSQIALKHGDFKKLMNNHRLLTIEFNPDNIELWVLEGRDKANDISTFFRDDQYKKKQLFGILLGMESKRVPKSMNLNLEDVLLINLKPFGQEWLTTTKLKSKSEKKQAETRAAMIKQFEESGEFNRIPQTYLGKDDKPKKKKDSGIVKTSILPEGLLGN